VSFQPLAEGRIGTLDQTCKAPDGSVIVRYAVQLRNDGTALGAVDRHQPIVARELQDELHALPSDAEPVADFGQR
jgi:hypothetical protein